jgi:hypothetical protein
MFCKSQPSHNYHTSIITVALETVNNQKTYSDSEDIFGYEAVDWGTILLLFWSNKLIQILGHRQHSSKPTRISQQPYGANSGKYWAKIQIS